MRPLKLEFEGINSFSERTVIDFERLTGSGIFGIFGDTGSGKSTILDCINFALFGKVERSKEKSDIINYRCNTAWVKFTFDMLNGGKRKKYYIERVLKGDKNKTHKAFLYEDDVCIANMAQEVEKKVVEILGVKAEDFRKCIALPQGEFAQFVKSGAQERLELIERLFSLSRYGVGLKNKISDRQNAITEEYQNISGKLSVYDDIAEDAVGALKEQIGLAKTELAAAAEKTKNCSEAYEKTKALWEKKCELTRVGEELSALNMRRAEMEKLRVLLAVLPACREAVACKEQIDRVNMSVMSAKKRLAELNRGAEKTEEELKNISVQIVAGDFENLISKHIDLAAKYKTCAGKPVRLANIRRQLEEKRAEYKTVEKRCSGLAEELNAAAAKVEKLEKQLSVFGANDIDNFVNVKFKGAVLRREYEASLEYFADLHADIEKYYDNSELYKFIETELKSQIKIYAQRVQDVKDFSLENVTGQFETLQNAMKEKDRLSALLNEAIRARGEIESNLKVAKEKLAAIGKDGAELKERYDETEAELKEVFGKDCRDFISVERENNDKLEELRQTRRELTEKAEAAKKTLADIKVEAGRREVEVRSGNDKIAELTDRLNGIIKDNSLVDIDNCKSIADSFSAYINAEKILKNFDRNSAVLTERMKQLDKTDGIHSVSESAITETENQKNAAENELAEINKNLAVAEAQLKSITERISEKKLLLKEKERIEGQLNLVSRLRELIRNNRFLEFIANEYLSDISDLASSTLLKLTDGRYFLRYVDNNFNVGDNFNGGSLRGVNTMSGGEIFLVSLSLALALSQTICSRSLKSIEFFFLDEGFGTLDGNLVDSVMTALEKLKSAQFTIGVISHVEELKHRIDNKITVFKATESHGSTVQINC